MPPLLQCVGFGPTTALVADRRVLTKRRYNKGNIGDNMFTDVFEKQVHKETEMCFQVISK